ncbi:hypothetical protein MNBD_GAMMA10-963 [hydrothermal vent metagenome]|uniref:Uncharacterized protein n=1 Tax=hydrothermal vent metagenome TaxID=652676 RepID=A0A3B0Y7B1_9ZZZZ
MYTENLQFDPDENTDFRDVTSTARLFNFRRPVYMGSEVWSDCVELKSGEDEQHDDLAVLQRLRHVLFMAASALHGRIEDLQYDFRIYRVMNGALHGQRQPEPVNLHLSAHKDPHNRPVITISFPVK